MIRDAVEEAGLESFPASDAPAWGNAANADRPTDANQKSDKKLGLPKVVPAREVRDIA